MVGRFLERSNENEKQMKGLRKRQSIADLDSDDEKCPETRDKGRGKVKEPPTGP
jgi:hypothetical protein